MERGNQITQWTIPTKFMKKTIEWIANFGEALADITPYIEKYMTSTVMKSLMNTLQKIMPL